LSYYPREPTTLFELIEEDGKMLANQSTGLPLFETEDSHFSTNNAKRRLTDF
jgi:hypothetical protein